METSSASKLNNLKPTKSELWTPYKNAVSERQRLILQALMYEGANGLTWKQLSKILNLHHGQISGALNGLHQLGLVFMLRTKKDGCYPYVSHLCRNQYTDEQVHDAPPPNKGKQRRQLLDELFAECLSIRASGSNDYRTSAISNLLDQIILHGDNKEPDSPKTEPQTKNEPTQESKSYIVPLDTRRFISERKKHKKRHKSRTETVSKRCETILATLRDMQKVGMKELCANEIAVLSGINRSDVYSSLHILRKQGKIGSQHSREIGRKVWTVLTWSDDINKHLAR